MKIRYDKDNLDRVQLCYNCTRLRNNLEIIALL